MNVFLNIILIPLLGVMGVSIAMVASQVIVFFVSASILAKRFHNVKFGTICLKPALAVLMMSLFIFLFRGINLVIIISSSIVLYGIALILLKTFSRDEISITRDLIKKALKSSIIILAKVILLCKVIA